jgi:sortase A
MRGHVTIRIAARASRYLRHCERTLCALGALLSACWAGAWLEGRVYQAYQNIQLNRSLQAESADTGIGPRRPLSGGVLGRLKIPRLGLSVLVLNGVDAATLILGAGRLPGVTQAGDAGNLVIAAHRDTFFRPLRDIRKDDQVLVTTADGTYAYVVEWTAVVNQSDTGVLANTREPALTLVTCYPFQYIGPAPQRFVVRARLSPGGKPLPAPDVALPDARPSPFLAHRRALQSAEEADAAREPDSSQVAQSVAPPPSAAEVDPPPTAPASHGIARLNPARLFKKIVQAAHGPKTEVGQALPPALPPANESGNQ